MTYLSLIVLIPLAALLTNAFNKGLGSFWTAVTQQE
jgi:ABC-type sulfate transport system permease component